MALGCHRTPNTGLQQDEGVPPACAFRARPRDSQHTRQRLGQSPKWFRGYALFRQTSPKHASVAQPRTSPRSRAACTLMRYRGTGVVRHVRTRVSDSAGSPADARGSLRTRKSTGKRERARATRERPRAPQEPGEGAAGAHNKSPQPPQGRGILYISNLHSIPHSCVTEGILRHNPPVLNKSPL
jgi:hypothetical protein